MIVSVTEVESFKRCRRQWDFGSFNRMGLSPIMQPKPYLDLGSMIHQSLAYWTQKPDSDLRLAFMRIATEHLKGVKETYKRATGTYPTDEMLEPLMDAITLGTAMMGNYQAFYGRPLPDDLEFCFPEQELLIPIPGTEHTCECEITHCDLAPEKCRNHPGGCTECNDTGVVYHYLKARLDALAKDTHGNLYVVERKTYDNRPNMALLEVTDQFIGYVWAAQQLNLGYVAGLAYDGMWKRAHPPQRPKRLEMADLFCRTMIRPTQAAVDEYGAELASTVLDMANPRIAVYKNRVWQGCWDCSFEQLCRAVSEQDDVDTILRTQYTKRVERDTIDIVTLVDGNGVPIATT